jgi:hypothetical protein
MIREQRLAGVLKVEGLAYIRTVREVDFHGYRSPPPATSPADRSTSMRLTTQAR